MRSKRFACNRRDVCSRRAVLRALAHLATEDFSIFSNLRGLLTLIVPCLARNVGTGNLSALLVEHEKRLEPRGPHEIATLTSS